MTLTAIRGLLPRLAVFKTKEEARQEKQKDKQDGGIREKSLYYSFHRKPFSLLFIGGVRPHGLPRGRTPVPLPSKGGAKEGREFDRVTSCAAYSPCGSCEALSFRQHGYLLAKQERPHGNIPRRGDHCRSRLFRKLQSSVRS